MPMNASGLDTILNALRGEKPAIGSEKSPTGGENADFLAAFDAAAKAADAQSRGAERANPAAAAHSGNPYTDRSPKAAPDVSGLDRSTNHSPSSSTNSASGQGSDDSRKAAASVAEGGKDLPGAPQGGASAAIDSSANAGTQSLGPGSANTPDNGLGSIGPENSGVGLQTATTQLGVTGVPGATQGVPDGLDGTPAKSSSVAQAVHQVVAQRNFTGDQGQGQLGSSSTTASSNSISASANPDSAADFGQAVRSAATAADATLGERFTSGVSQSAAGSAAADSAQGRPLQVTSNVSGGDGQGKQAATDMLSNTAGSNTQASSLGAREVPRGTPTETGSGLDKTPSATFAASAADASGRGAESGLGRQGLAGAGAAGADTQASNLGAREAPKGTPAGTASGLDKTPSSSFAASAADASGRGADSGLGRQGLAGAGASGLDTQASSLGAREVPRGTPAETASGLDKTPSAAFAASAADASGRGSESGLGRQGLAGAGAAGADIQASNLGAREVSRGTPAETASGLEKTPSAAFAARSADDSEIKTAADSAIVRQSVVDDSPEQRFARFANSLRGADGGLATATDRSGSDLPPSALSGNPSRALGGDVAASSAGRSEIVADALNDGRLPSEDVAAAAGRATRETMTDAATTQPRGFEQALAQTQALNPSATTRASDNSAALMTQLPDLEAGPDTPEFPQEVLGRIRLLQNQGAQEARLNLHPAELGRLQISIVTEGDSARVAFTVDNPQARDALEAAMPRLREMLQQAGLQLADSSVAQQGQQQARDSSGESPSESRQTASRQGGEDDPSNEGSGKPRPDPDRTIDAYA